MLAGFMLNIRRTREGVKNMTLGYWKLDRQPFERSPDAAMYFGMHQAVDDAASELLSAIEEGSDCMALVAGQVGVGTSTCLRAVLDTLDRECFRVAFVTDPVVDFTQLLRDIIGQLEGDLCTEELEASLMRRFNRILTETAEAGMRVAIFIDQSDTARIPDIESLGKLAKLQNGWQGLFTVVIAGQPELARRIEDPRRSDLYRRIGIFCRLDGISSRDTTKDYIEHRLERAGLSGESPFTQAAYDAIWRFSCGGVPLIINKICNRALMIGETQCLHSIDANLVMDVGRKIERAYCRLLTMAHKAFVSEIKPEHQEVAPAPATVEPLRLRYERRAVEKVPIIPELIPAQYGPRKQEVKHVSRLSNTIDFKVLTQEEKEKLASELATERTKDIVGIQDPFEAWNRAREEILKEMAEERGEPATVGHAAA
ncbi:MAG: hypothetical protein C0404_04775 [Verrucomicrobia bacterium]|nr:hypothetical protein [Verrucomicrobiota bacterium]